jgi:hypothetical protein
LDLAEDHDSEQEQLWNHEKEESLQEHDALAEVLVFFSPDTCCLKGWRQLQFDDDDKSISISYPIGHQIRCASILSIFIRAKIVIYLQSHKQFFKQFMRF